MAPLVVQRENLEGIFFYTFLYITFVVRSLVNIKNALRYQI